MWPSEQKDYEIMRSFLDDEMDYTEAVEAAISKRK